MSKITLKKVSPNMRLYDLKGLSAWGGITFVKTGQIKIKFSSFFTIQIRKQNTCSIQVGWKVT